ncbi:MAG: UDP-N-acetylmuramoyl-L-alanyl-D-glutamate--2,6-diaminopimelate ligase [Steroidobacteraceae bacterium]
MSAAPHRNTSGCELAELLGGLAQVPRGLRVTDVTLESRAVTPGALFLACRGRTHHGLAFATEALARGAVAVLYEPPAEVPAALSAQTFFAPVAQLSARAGLIADRFFGEPSRALGIGGITGTNGKTTCAWLLSQAFEHSGRSAAYLGTLGYGRTCALQHSRHTTADAVTLHRQLAEVRALGARWVAMEVSSHALDQQRIAAVRVHTAAFTNLTRDHLDYHGTLEAYGRAKARLFELDSLVNRVINLDDPFGASLAARGGPGALIVTTRGAAIPAGARFVRAVAADAHGIGLRIAVDSSWGSGALEVPLIGDFNVDNVLTVLAVLLGAEVPFAAAIAALQHCGAAPGRMEAFGGQAGQPLVIVDYAHTPDALAKALENARRHCRGRLRVVFGCGGDRDRGKRPMMGRIAAELADEIILTDDNPRTEAPQHITAQILEGIAPHPARVEHDRASAIGAALQASGAQDVVLIAGKGHETYQTYGAEQRPFSDQAVVRAVLGLSAENP